MSSFYFTFKMCPRYNKAVNSSKSPGQRVNYQVARFLTYPVGYLGHFYTSRAVVLEGSSEALIYSVDCPYHFELQVGFSFSSIWLMSYRASKDIAWLARLVGGRRVFWLVIASNKKGFSRKRLRYSLSTKTNLIFYKSIVIGILNALWFSKRSLKFGLLAYSF